MTTVPDARAREAVISMAVDAAWDDDWMTPCPEDHLGAGDLGDITQAHREGWQETDHFRACYGRPILDIALASSGMLDDHACYESHFIPLLDLFWEIWEESVGFYERAGELTR